MRLLCSARDKLATAACRWQPSRLLPVRDGAVVTYVNAQVEARPCAVGACLDRRSVRRNGAIRRRNAGYVGVCCWSRGRTADCRRRTDAEDPAAGDASASRTSSEYGALVRQGSLNSSSGRARGRRRRWRAGVRRRTTSRALPTMVRGSSERDWAPPSDRSCTKQRDAGRVASCCVCRWGTRA